MVLLGTVGAVRRRVVWPFGEKNGNLEASEKPGISSGDHVGHLWKLQIFA